jgi:hypothetical protein
MSPELLKETILACVSLASAAVPSVFLVWWTWKRDQENVIVQKWPQTMNNVHGNPVILKDGYGAPRLIVLIRNRSLFSVRVSAVGFDIDGAVYQWKHPSVPLKMKPNPDLTSNRPNIPDDSIDPWEIHSGAHLRVQSISSWDSSQLKETLERAATKRKTDVDKLIWSKRVQALVMLESGKQFASGSRIRRLFKSTLRSISGWSNRSAARSAAARADETSGVGTGDSGD